ncbi:aminoglycoside phosphotransferase family protein [Pseudoduganella ginsengisoli]|uniref:Aminoglycoside phosphotransferase domain-containing protein n=1 Tax=Pseudoduganella ginsengisoli TaxID=1462440 RepID=A0A6L6PZT0_9BURK|nr:phosphotransferase [Pseudoduganella ginsengisoli]MTW02641.1 hypothetical protein [Pseudoduganella ginsengisoli]
MTGLSAAVTAFCARHGASEPLQAVALRAGRNSEVLRITDHRGNSTILKQYFSHQADTRDRLGTEYGFLDFCSRHGVTAVPRTLGMDKALNCALYALLPGQRPVELTDDHMAQAAAFIASLNTLRDAEGADRLPFASDACTAVQTHLDLAQRRIDGLLACAPANGSSVSAIERDAHAFVRNTLAPAWERRDAAARAALAAEGDLSAPLPRTALILSPSDFGFHNTLQHDDRLAFVDFEYAGWDDPAKLICDFQCQPEVPVSAAHGTLFQRTVLAALRDDGAIARRIAAVLPLHRIKWCGILLNELRAQDRQRRLHAGIAADGLLEIQLAKARTYFETHLV